eukprot:236301-Alexandrium_andersonii.AAC.1
MAPKHCLQLPGGGGSPPSWPLLARRRTMGRLAMSGRAGGASTCMPGPRGWAIRRFGQRQAEANPWADIGECVP